MHKTQLPQLHGIRQHNSFTFLSLGYGPYAFLSKEAAENMKQSRDKLVYAHTDVKIGYLNGLRISSENLITVCGLLLVLLKS